LAALAPGLHEAGAVEHGEVLDDRHAANRELTGQRRRGALAPLGEQAEHAPAGRVRQGGEHAFRRRAHQAATFSAYLRSSSISNSQPPLLLLWFLVRCSSDVASDAKPLSTTRSRVPSPSASSVNSTSVEFPSSGSIPPGSLNGAHR